MQKSAGIKNNKIIYQKINLRRREKEEKINRVATLC